MRLSLMGSSAEILRIEDGNYYITNEDWGCFQKVDLETFKKKVESLKKVCTTTWDKEMRKEYQEIVDYIKEI